MKICYSVVKNIRRGGGIEKYTADLGERLVRRGHEVTVYSMTHYGDVPVEYRGMKIRPCPTIPGKMGEKLISGAVAAARIRALGGYDIIHQHSIAAGAFNWLAVSSRRQASLLQMHGIEWHRTKWSAMSRRVISALERFAMSQYAHWTAVSRTQCRILDARYGIKTVYIPTATEISPCVPCDEIRRQWGLEPRGYLLFASRLVPEKGAHYLIEAFRGIKGTLAGDLRLVIAGDAPNEPAYTRRLEDLARGDERILFTGYVEGHKLKELFSNCRLFVQPSEIEGLSIALLEAMSYGNCCLVSDIPENLEAIGPCGLAFENRNSASLRHRIEELLADPAQADAFGQAAIERIRTNYSWDLVTDQMEELYRTMLATHC